MFSSVTIEKAERSRSRPRLGSAAGARALRWLATHANWCAALLGLFLLAPALETGLVADDYLQELMLRDPPGLQGLSHQPFDLFRLADGQPATASRLINEGVYPWWVDPTARLAFFRPLSSSSHVIDHLFWPGNALLMHLHSLLWFGLLLLVVAAVYRRFGALEGPSSLALLLFALDDSHAPVVGWIANRNALIALCLALPAVLAHDGSRRERFRHGLWLGPVCFALGLLGGEVAVCVLGYLIAYAVHLDRGSRLERWGALLPYVIVLVGWKLWCLREGYGARGSGIYVDPGSEPIRFLQAMAERLPVLGLGLLALPFADLWEAYPLISPFWRVGIWLLGVAVLALFARALVRPWKQDASLRFWVTGSALTLVPACATFPHDRMLLAPSVGAMAAVAALLRRGWAGRESRLTALGAGALAAVHLVLAPVLLPLRALAVGQFSHVLWRTNQTLPIPAEDWVGDRTLILINPPVDPLAAYLPVYREVARQPRMGQQLWLTTGASDVVLTILDEHRMLVRPETGFLCNGFQRMLRDESRPFQLGDRVQLDGATVEVAKLTSDGRPLEVIVSFERSLRDPRLIWLRWLGQGYGPLQLPAVGESVVLPKVDLYQLLFVS